MTEELNIDDTNAVSFLDTARVFCRQIESSDWKDSDGFIENIHTTLVRLYYYGLEMPLVDLSNFYADTLELAESIIDTALQNLKKNTPFQYYWTVLNPLENEMPSTGTGDLIDDLLDIYKDLKLGIIYFDEVEGYKEWSYWVFKMAFRNHWSDHCVNAIQIIHEYLSNKE